MQCEDNLFKSYVIFRPNKKIPVLRVTRPYLNLNLLMKPRILFSGFLKKYNFMHFERQNAFQNA